MTIQKAWVKSKTIWWNVVTAIVAVLAMPDVVSMFPPEWLGAIGVINAIGNIALRFVTTKPIGATDVPD